MIGIAANRPARDTKSMNKWWIALLLAGCASETPDRICAACEPERLGDTGDLGGEQTPCWGYRAPEPVDATRAVELGFDVEALESAIARPIDMPMEWRTSDNPWAGGPARGYDPLTNVTVRVRSARVYRHMRPDPQYCDGTTCRWPGGDAEPQANCARALETDVQVEVATADGAVRGTLFGTAMQVHGGSEATGLAAWTGLVEATAPLSQIKGSLRLDPQRGAQGYRSELYVHLLHSAAAARGNLVPRVFIDTSDFTGIDYSPIVGVFPREGNLGPALGDGGVRR
jgi:hypothetical protein